MHLSRLDAFGIPMNPGNGHHQHTARLHQQASTLPLGFQQTLVGTNGLMTTRIRGPPQILLHHAHTPHGLVRVHQPCVCKFDGNCWGSHTHFQKYLHHNQHGPVPKPVGFIGGGQPKQRQNGSGFLLFDYRYSRGAALIVVRECKKGKHNGKWGTFYGKVNQGDTLANTAKKELREESQGALKIEQHTIANCPFVRSHKYSGQGVFVAKVESPIGGLQLKKVFAYNATVISAQNGPSSFRETNDIARVLVSNLQQALQMQSHGDVFVVGSHGEQILLRARECSYLRSVFQQNLHNTAPVLQATFNSNIQSRIPCLNRTQCYELA
jgi:hypothetical protein